MWLQLLNTGIWYQRLGKGPAVVLLHGFGEAGWVFDSLHPLSNKHCLLIPDLPGSGRSAGAALATLDEMAAIVQQLLAIEHLSEASILGHSMGGYVALSFAEQFPENTTGLGLLHSTAYADTAEKKETRKKGISFIQQWGAAAFLKTFVPNLYAPGNSSNKEALIKAHLEQSQNFSNEALMHYYQTMMARPDRTGTLSGSAAPVLFILGRHDSAIPLQDGITQSSLPAVASVHIMEGSGHMGMLEEKEQTIEAIETYLGQGQKMKAGITA